MLFALGLALAACDHSAGYLVPDLPRLGPWTATDPIRLTLNGDQDYWPAWAEDGAGVLYSYVQPGRPDGDRCVGLIPASGGTQTWHLCETRATHEDSTDSFGGYALGSEGQLLYFQVTALSGKEVPDHGVLWLADTTSPFDGRRPMAETPIAVGGAVATWFSNLQWEGETTFLALAQRYEPFPHCRFCNAADTALFGLTVVRGTITTTGASLAAIPGTTDAVAYSLAENGTSLVVAFADSLVLHLLPVQGGSAVRIDGIPADSLKHVTGLSCAGAICLVSTDRGYLRPHPFASPPDVPSPPPPTGEVWQVDLASGIATRIVAADTSRFLSGAVLRPDGTDFVVQAGGGFGVRQSNSTPLVDLLLYRGLRP
jgi:hypothetical protein